jgi:hypothetical protein
MRNSSNSFMLYELQPFCSCNYWPTKWINGWADQFYIVNFYQIFISIFPTFIFRESGVIPARHEGGTEEQYVKILCRSMNKTRLICLKNQCYMWYMWIQEVKINISSFWKELLCELKRKCIFFKFLSWY